METSLSLLDRLGDKPTDDDWRRLLELYQPLLRSWMARAGVEEHAIDDLSQDVLLVVFREVVGFERRGPGAFRGWLRAILANRTSDYFRSRQRHQTATHDLSELESPASSLSAVWDREHDEHVVATLLQQVEPHFTPITWQAFQRHVLQGVLAPQVAEELSLSLNSVLLAKSRVLKRLRQELGKLID